VAGKEDLTLAFDLPFETKLIPNAYLLSLFDLKIETRCLPSIEVTSREDFGFTFQL